MSTQWVWQSLSAMGLLIPFWIAVQFFGKNFGVSSELFLVFASLGTTAAIGVFVRLAGPVTMPPLWIIVSMIAIGLIIGGGANLLLMRSVANAPNPGLPLAIMNMLTIGVFLTSMVLARWLPNYFEAAKCDAWSFFGIALTVVGTSIIVLRR